MQPTGGQGSGRQYDRQRQYDQQSQYGQQPNYDQQGGRPQQGGAGATGGWSGPGYAPAQPQVAVKDARPWLNGLFAGLTMLVLILITGNQWVADRVLRSAVGGGNGFANDAKYVAIAYQFRLSRLGSDNGNLFLSGIFFDIAVVGLVFLLTAGVTRGRGGFGHIFLGTWLSVIVASLVGGYLRAAIVDAKFFGVPTSSKAEFVVFRQPFANATTLTAAIIFGVVVALVAGLIGAAAARRHVIGGQPAAGSPGAYAPPPPSGAQQDRREAWSAPPAPGTVAEPSPWTKDSDERTTSFDKPNRSTSGAASDDADRTQALPAYGSQSDSSAEHTTQLPRAESGEDDPPRHTS